MTSPFIKICGVTQVDQAQALADLEIQAIGLIGVPQTPRYLIPEQMRAIVAALPTSLETVGVFRDHPIAELVQIVEHVGLTTLQLHGQETPNDCGELARCCPQIRLIKAFRLRDPQDLEIMGEYQAVVDRVLVDTYHPQQWGGTGIPLNWSLLQPVSFPRPWILAGGLNPHNIRAALTTVQPFGIDVSSGVEVSPGVKDLDKVKQLLAEIKTLSSPASETHPSAERSAPSPPQSAPSPLAPDH